MSELTTDDVVRVKVPLEHLERIYEHAQNATIGGRSNVRETRNANSPSQVDDQFIGQLGQYAGVTWITGSPDPYFESRVKQDEDPWKGDGGSDVPGFQIDIKTSVMRVAGREPVDYMLPVRPKERHANNVYVLALVPQEFDGVDNNEVLLVGWASDDMLPNRLRDRGVFRGAYVLEGRYMNRMADLDPVPTGKELLETGQC